MNNVPIKTEYDWMLVGWNKKQARINLILRIYAQFTIIYYIRVLKNIYTRISIGLMSLTIRRIKYYE